MLQRRKYIFLPILMQLLMNCIAFCFFSKHFLINNIFVDWNCGVFFNGITIYLQLGNLQLDGPPVYPSHMLHTLLHCWYIQNLTLLRGGNCLPCE